MVFPFQSARSLSQTRHTEGLCTEFSTAPRNNSALLFLVNPTEGQAAWRRLGEFVANLFDPFLLSARAELDGGLFTEFSTGFVDNYPRISP